jgi:hypothetical protein
MQVMLLVILQLQVLFGCCKVSTVTNNGSTLTTFVNEAASCRPELMSLWQVGRSGDWLLLLLLLYGATRSAGAPCPSGCLAT